MQRHDAILQRTGCLKDVFVDVLPGLEGNSPPMLWWKIGMFFFSERGVKGKIFRVYFVGKPSIPRLCPECISVCLYMYIIIGYWLYIHWWLRFLETKCRLNIQYKKKYCIRMGVTTHCLWVMLRAGPNCSIIIGNLPLMEHWVFPKEIDALNPWNAQELRKPKVHLMFRHFVWCQIRVPGKTKGHYKNLPFSVLKTGSGSFYSLGRLFSFFICPKYLWYHGNLRGPLPNATWDPPRNSRGPLLRDYEAHHFPLDSHDDMFFFCQDLQGSFEAGT